MHRGSEPETLGRALANLIAIRGLARVRGDAHLATAWRAVAGEQVAASTKPLSIRRGVLHVAVGNAPLLGELAGFQKPSLLAALGRDFPELKIRDLKFVLKGDLFAA